MTILNVISHCGKTWLVGINCLDIRKNGISSKDFLAIGNNELAELKKLPKEMACIKCGKLVKVKKVGKE